MTVAMVVAVVVMFMPTAATVVRVRVPVVVRFFLFPLIILSATASTMSVSVSVVVLMGVMIVMVILLVVVVVMPAAVVHFLGTQGSEIEDAQQNEADASGERHRAEPTLRHGRQVVRDAATDVEVEHHTAPKNEERDADEMEHGFLDSHGSAG